MARPGPGGGVDERVRPVPSDAGLAGVVGQEG